MARNNSEAVKKWRITTKIRMVEAMGGKCSICGYHKCVEALDFHHLDPNEKDFGFGKTRANPKRWSLIVEELRKCVLLCSNCHREVHYGLAFVPEDSPKFDERFVDYKQEKICKTDECPVCKTQKPIYNTTCSYQCAAKISYKVKWDEIDLKALLESGKSYSEIGRMVGCSETAVRKRAIKNGVSDSNKFVN